MPAVHDVQPVIVPVVLAVHQDSADCEVLALIGDEGPFRGIPQVHPLYLHVFAFPEVDQFGSLRNPVVLGIVHKVPEMDLVKEIQRAVEAASVDAPLSLDRDVLLPY